MGLLYTHSYYVEPSTIPWDWEDNVVISLVYGGGTRGIGSYLTVRSWPKNLEPVPLACVTQNLPWRGTPSATEPFSLPLSDSTSSFAFFLSSSASPETPTGSPRRLLRPSADTQAASMRRGRKTAPWTPLPSSKRSWSSGGSPRAVLIPSGWRRCGWRWAAPASRPSSAAQPDKLSY